jgi:arabinogalactan oligomer/maltooligosaccharide transport system permease protein
VAVASLILPGLGQFINKQVIKGLIWLAIPILLLAVELSTSHWDRWLNLETHMVTLPLPPASTPPLAETGVTSGAVVTSSSTAGAHEATKAAETSPAVAKHPVEKRVLPPKKIAPQAHTLGAMEEESSSSSNADLYGDASSSKSSSGTTTDMYGDVIPAKPKAPAKKAKPVESKTQEAKASESKTTSGSSSDDLYGPTSTPAKKAGSGETSTTTTSSGSSDLYGSTSSTPSSSSGTSSSTAGSGLSATSAAAAQALFVQHYTYPNYAYQQGKPTYVFRDFGGFFTKGLWGLGSLGALVIGDQYAGKKIALFDQVSDWLTADNSVNLMGNGLIAVIILLIMAFLWVLGVADAYQSRVEMIKTGKVETFTKFIQRVWHTLFSYIVSAPAFVAILFFTVIPFVFTFILAFTNYTYKVHLGQGLVQWVGFHTFTFLALDPAWLLIFGQIFAWTVFWALMSSFTVFALGFINAMVVESPLVKGRKIWRALLILPWALPQLIVLMVFKNVFDTAGLANQLLFATHLMGPVTNFLSAIGLEGHPDQPIFWFTQFYNGNLAKFVVVMVNLWFGAPYHMMMIIGILSAIPKDMYEAAEVDGANGFQRFRSITMPMVLSATVPALIMTFSFNFNNFGAVYFLTGGGPAWNPAQIPDSMKIIASALPGQTDILISWIYKLSFTKGFEQFNVAAVYSIIIFLIVGGFSVFNMVRSKSFSEEGNE